MAMEPLDDLSFLLTLPSLSSLLAVNVTITGLLYPSDTDT